MAVGVDQVDPLKVRKLPARSPTAQHVAVGHDTGFIIFVPATLVGADQVDPLKSRTFPALSSATQNDIEEQEIDEREAEPSIGLTQVPVRVVQFTPLKPYALAPPTAMQKDAETQESSVRLGAPLAAVDQVEPPVYVR
jgi:hypothetical protein